MDGAARAAHSVPRDLWNPIRIEDQDRDEGPEEGHCVNDGWDEWIKRRGVSKIVLCCAVPCLAALFMMDSALQAKSGTAWALTFYGSMKLSPLLRRGRHRSGGGI